MLSNRTAADVRRKIPSSAKFAQYLRVNPTKFFRRNDAMWCPLGHYLNPDPGDTCADDEGWVEIGKKKVTGWDEGDRKFSVSLPRWATKFINEVDITWGKISGEQALRILQRVVRPPSVVRKRQEDGKKSGSPRQVSRAGRTARKRKQR